MLTIASLREKRGTGIDSVAGIIYDRLLLRQDCIFSTPDDQSGVEKMMVVVLMG